MAENIEFYIKDATDRMDALGLYKPEFIPAIKRYADMREQYDVLTARWRRERYKVYVKTDDGVPSKRNPLCIAIESLRKDITNLESMLGLTPQGLLKADDTAFRKKKVNALAAAMNAASE